MTTTHSLNTRTDLYLSEGHIQAIRGTIIGRKVAFVAREAEGDVSDRVYGLALLDADTGVSTPVNTGFCRFMRQADATRYADVLNTTSLGLNPRQVRTVLDQARSSIPCTIIT